MFNIRFLSASESAQKEKEENDHLSPFELDMLMHAYFIIDTCHFSNFKEFLEKLRSVGVYDCGENRIKRLSYDQCKTIWSIKMR